MAISQNQKIEYTDLKSKYDSFNTFITNYGGSIAKLTVPANSPNPHPVDDADINNLNGKINEFKADTYLKTQTSWWVNATVTAGNPAKASDWTNINTTISNFSKVKCRNSGTNSYTLKNHSCQYGTHNHNCSYGTNTHTCSPLGTYSNNCANGTCSNTSGASDGGSGDWTGCYATCTGLAGFSVSPANQSNSNGCGYKVSITYSTNTATCSQYNRSITFRVTGSLAGKHWQNVGAQGATITACNQAWQEWSSKFSGYTSRVATACSFGTGSTSCSHGPRTHQCSHGTPSVPCSHGTKSHNCSQIRNTNGTFYDITCSHTSRTHG